MTRHLVLAAALTLAASSISCTLLHRNAASPRTPKPANTFEPPPPRVAPEPAIDVPPPEVEPADNLAQYQVELPNPAWHNRRRPPRAKESVTETEVEPDPPKPAVAELPPLEQILTPEQQKEYKDAIDRNLGRAHRTVDTLSTRKLNSEQHTYMGRIKEFIDQAEDARKNNDLVRAKNLAERAGVLADDLIKSVP